MLGQACARKQTVLTYVRVNLDSPMLPCQPTQACISLWSQALETSPVEASHKVQIGSKLTRGLGAGGDPAIGTVRLMRGKQLESFLLSARAVSCLLSPNPRLTNICTLVEHNPYFPPLRRKPLWRAVMQLRMRSKVQTWSLSQLAWVVAQAAGLPMWWPPLPKTWVSWLSASSQLRLPSRAGNELCRCAHVSDSENF